MNCDRHTTNIMSQDRRVICQLLLLGLTCWIVGGRPDVGVHTQGKLVSKLNPSSALARNLKTIEKIGFIKRPFLVIHYKLKHGNSFLKNDLFFSGLIFAFPFLFWQSSKKKRNKKKTNNF